MTDTHLFWIMTIMAAAALALVSYTLGERHGREGTAEYIEAREERLDRLLQGQDLPECNGEPSYDACVDLLESWHSEPGNQQEFR